MLGFRSGPTAAPRRSVVDLAAVLEQSVFCRFRRGLQAKLAIGARSLETVRPLHETIVNVSQRSLGFGSAVRFFKFKSYTDEVEANALAVATEHGNGGLS